MIIWVILCKYSSQLKAETQLVKLSFIDLGIFRISESTISDFAHNPKKTLKVTFYISNLFNNLVANHRLYLPTQVKDSLLKSFILFTIMRFLSLFPPSARLFSSHALHTESLPKFLCIVDNFMYSAR